MSKTPRTDAVAWDEWIHHGTIGVVPSSFARELELELAAKDAECKELKEKLYRNTPPNQQYWPERK